MVEHPRGGLRRCRSDAPLRTTFCPLEGGKRLRTTFCPLEGGKSLRTTFWPRKGPMGPFRGQKVAHNLLPPFTTDKGAKACAQGGKMGGLPPQKVPEGDIACPRFAGAYCTLRVAPRFAGGVVQSHRGVQLPRASPRGGCSPQGQRPWGAPKGKQTTIAACGGCFLIETRHNKGLKPALPPCALRKGAKQPFDQRSLEQG